MQENTRTVRFGCSKWSCWADLNRRPHPYQCCMNIDPAYNQDACADRQAHTLIKPNENIILLEAGFVKGLVRIDPTGSAALPAGVPVLALRSFRAFFAGRTLSRLYLILISPSEHTDIESGPTSPLAHGTWGDPPRLSLNLNIQAFIRWISIQSTEYDIVRGLTEKVDFSGVPEGGQDQRPYSTFLGFRT